MATSIRLLCIIAALLCSVAQSATDQPYELKGESPGMTLMQFKSNHKHAECSNRTSNRISCRVDDGISFAGITAMTHKGCATLECSAQGIFANFVDERMVSLSYGVAPGHSGEIIEALKKKFGEPKESTEHSATWRNSVGYLLVSETVVPSPDGSKQDIATLITSSLNDGGGGKDI
jgi:hypothetical protein